MEELEVDPSNDVLGALDAADGSVMSASLDQRFRLMQNTMVSMNREFQALVKGLKTEVRYAIVSFGTKRIGFDRMCCASNATANTGV